MAVVFRTISLLVVLSSGLALSTVSRKGVFVVEARYEDPGNLVANISMGTPCKS